jgi:hypothetical protein
VALTDADLGLALRIYEEHEAGGICRGCAYPHGQPCEAYRAAADELSRRRTRTPVHSARAKGET